MAKILVLLAETNSAVSQYRLKVPYEHIKSLGYDVDILLIKDVKNIEEYDIIHFHVNWLVHKAFWVMLDMLKCKKIMDIDDYWIIPSTNPHAKNHTVRDYVDYFKKVDLITTTTKQLKKYIKPYNRNIEIIPNIVIHPIVQPTFKSGWTRVGLIGGSSHLYDLKEIEGFVKHLNLNKVQLVLAGFSKAKDSPWQFSIWNQFEQIMTDDYRILDDRQHEYLASYNSETYPIETAYKRLHSLEFDKYYSVFEHVDIVLAPLQDTPFNRGKSELKAVEAGTFGKVLVASDVGVYKDFRDEALLFKSGPKEVAKHLNNLTNIDYRLELADKLQEKIKSRYSVEEITNKRIKLWY